MKRYSIILSTLLFPFLSACAPIKLNDDRAGICNELNSKIIFNASTTDTRMAEIQSAEEALMQHSYQKNQCDKKKM